VMKSPELPRYLWIGVITAVAFAVAQGLLAYRGWAGVACVRWITGPDPQAYPQIEWIQYGVPWRFLQIEERGCDQRMVEREFSPLGLAADLLIFAAAGAGVYLVLNARGRWRRGGPGEVEANDGPERSSRFP